MRDSYFKVPQIFENQTKTNEILFQIFIKFLKICQDLRILSFLSNYKTEESEPIQFREIFITITILVCESKEIMEYQILNEEHQFYQARKLIKNSKNKNEIPTLQQLSHFQVMQMCCKIAEIDNEEVNCNWRSHLQTLPHFLLDNLKSDFDHLCPSRSPLFAFDIEG